LCFLGKAICQDQQSAAIEKAQQSENVISKLYADLPNTFAINQLFEILPRYYIQLFNQLQYPQNFLRLFASQGIKKFFNRAVVVREAIKVYCPHIPMLSQM
jgi:hypothetical protein